VPKLFSFVTVCTVCLLGSVGCSCFGYFQKFRLPAGKKSAWILMSGKMILQFVQNCTDIGTKCDNFFSFNPFKVFKVDENDGDCKFYK